jgi:hypothetical protein
MDQATVSTVGLTPPAPTGPIADTLGLRIPIDSHRGHSAQDETDPEIQPQPAAQQPEPVG